MVRSMPSHDYTQQLEALWQRSLAAYRAGKQTTDTLFNEPDTAFLRSIGATKQEVFDFVDDHVRYAGQPDYTTFALLTDIRRTYFLRRQNGVFSGKTIPPSQLPAKSAAVDGIEWLPRLIAKAKAKLRGEMDPDTMYGCAGDRGFFVRHDIHPAEFLRVVECFENDEPAIVAFVKSRTA